MIRCTQCKAPIDWTDESCWHCQTNLNQHPLHTDLRYVIAYSRLSRFVFNAALTLGILLLLAGAVQAPFSRSFIEAMLPIACFGVPLLIALLRLAL